MRDLHGSDDLIADEETGIILTQIAPESETAEFDFLELVATLEDEPVDELPLLYDEVDHLVERLFKTPPRWTHRSRSRSRMRATGSRSTGTGT